MDLKTLIHNTGAQTHPVVLFNDYLPLDLSAQNKALDDVDLNDEQSFTDFVFNQLKSEDKPVGIGGYGEVRSLYSRSNLFEGEEPRTIHLGIDIWAEAGTTIYAPLRGEVHSFANRAVHGDYGPVIILKHRVGTRQFYSLYGHLSTDSLTGLKEGMIFEAGEPLAKMGAYYENFHWPPHLHFQLMKEIGDLKGDYPGVCKASEKLFYLANCPDPSIFIFK